MYQGSNKERPHGKPGAYKKGDFCDKSVKQIIPKNIRLVI